MTSIKSICLYCGSSSDARESHKKAATEFGLLLAQNDKTLVFGGGRLGLMGLAADAALRAGGSVIGIIPEFLFEREVGHKNCTRLYKTNTMHERKECMAELSDAFVILPGGFGTLDEAFEIISWRQLGLHKKPIVIFNVDSYWDPLESLFRNLYVERYISENMTNLVQSVAKTEDILPTIQNMNALNDIG